jgi:hypothetical protein
MSDEVDWPLRVKALLKSELKKRNVSYKQLATMLKEIGVIDSEANIKNKISRGGFTAVFFVQCLSAIGCHTLRIDEVGFQVGETN